VASLAGAPSEAARRLTAKAPATAMAGGLKGPVGPGAGGLPTSIYSPLPAGFVAPASPAAAGGSAPPAQVAVAGPTLPTGPAAPGSGAAAPPSDPTDCRLACARSYYFCLAGADPTDCPRSWTQCLADCGKPAPPGATPP